MGRFLMLLAVLVQLAGKIEVKKVESSKITINAHTTSSQLHQRSITLHQRSITTLLITQTFFSSERFILKFTPECAGLGWCLVSPLLPPQQTKSWKVGIIYFP